MIIISKRHTFFLLYFFVSVSNFQRFVLFCRKTIRFMFFWLQHSLAVTILFKYTGA
ncbi:hypothetical protein BDF21DRAFT_429426 [Thamnidium elegans]|nr:hypothetical protein BDF21DRAFT_429426 [Thamnidium elegans]